MPACPLCRQSDCRFQWDRPGHHVSLFNGDVL